MILQIPDELIFDLDSILAPLITVFILLVLMVIIVGLYLKVRIFLAILIVFVFSMVIGSSALSINIPFTPYLQIFFMLFQTLFFLLTILGVFSRHEKH